MPDPRSRGRALIAAALAGATFVFLYAFRNDGIFHLDAIFLAQAVEKGYAGDGWDTHWRFGAVLANALVYFPFWLAGENAERATILASILFDAASIAVAFLFLERLAGDRLLAALAAGLLAVVPVYTIANTFGKEYGLALLLVLSAFHLALRARATASAPRAAASGLCFACAYTVWEGLLALTPIYLVVLCAPCGGWPTLPRRLIAGSAAGFAVGVAFGLSTSLPSTVGAYTAGQQMTGFLGFTSPMLPVALRDLIRFLGWPLLLASALGLGLALAEARYRALLPLAALLVATVVIYGNLSTYGPRYLVFSALGLCMLAAVGFHFLLTHTPPLQLAALAAYVAAVGWMIGVSYPLLAPRHAYNGAKRYALWVGTATEPSSLIIVMDDSRFIEYYARRATLGHPIGDPAGTAAWVERVRDALQRSPVYLTQSGLFYDPGRIVRQAIDANFTRTLVGTRPSEDYHHAEGRLRTYEASLWRLTAK